METKILQNLGFTKIEIEIYIDLAKHGESSASEIAKRISVSRTYLYDAIENLIKKGVLVYILKNNRRIFRNLPYEKLLEFVDNKKNELDESKKEINYLINELKKSNNHSKENPLVEILEGKEGLKTILNDIISTGKDTISWGATSKIYKYIPDWFIERYIKEKDKKNIKTRQLFVKGEKPLEGKGYINKQMDKSSSNPVTFSSYGNKIAIFFWSENPIIIRIQNKEISESFKEHFSYLWRLFSK